MAYQTIKHLSAAALLLASSAAYAGSSSFALVSGDLVPGIDVTLTVQKSTQPGYDYDFVITNNSVQGIITGVYFEQLWNGKVWGAGTSFGDAILYPGSLTPEIDPWIGPKSSHTVTSTPVYSRTPHRGGEVAYKPLIQQGIHAGTSQTFSFITDTEKVSLDDLTDVVGSKGFGIAIRLHELLDESLEAGWGLAGSIPEQEQAGEFLFATALRSVPQTGDGGDDGSKVYSTPTPTAAFAGLTMLGLLSLRRRRA